MHSGDGVGPPVRRVAPQALNNGRYELREFIGKGGMGAVYRAHDVELDRSVAVKCLLDGARRGSRDLANKEARTLASLNHPNIMRVFDILSNDDQVWIVTEWLEGKCLSQLPLPLPPACVLAIFVQLLDALAAAHAANVIHRDVKPRNVMISRGGRVTLIDFGVAYAPGMSTGETLAGSLRYTDPRILDGLPPDAASDLYSAALLAVELMTGETVLPDLAPLPLYRYIKRHGAGRLDDLLDGAYPPLADLASRSLGRDRLSVSGGDAGPAREAALLALAALRKLTPKAPETYLAEGLCRGDVADAAAAALVAEETLVAIRSPLLTPRQKAAWIAYKSETEALCRTAPALPRAARLPGSGRRKRRREPLLRAIAAAAMVLAATVWTLAAAPGARPLPPPAAAGAAPNPRALGNSAPVKPKTGPEGSAAFALPPGLPPQAASADVNAFASAGTGTAAPRPVASIAVHFVANAWATVTVDGREVGRLPQAAPFLLSPGRHALRLTNPAVEPLSTEIQVAAPTRLRFSLVPKVTPRVFRLAHPGRLFIDGRDLGMVTAKVVPLPYGTHQVWVQRGSLAGRSRSLVLGPDSPGEIRLE